MIRILFQNVVVQLQGPFCLSLLLQDPGEQVSPLQGVRIVDQGMLVTGLSHPDQVVCMVGNCSVTKRHRQLPTALIFERQLEPCVGTFQMIFDIFLESHQWGRHWNRFGRIAAARQKQHGTDEKAGKDSIQRNHSP